MFVLNIDARRYVNIHVLEHHSLRMVCAHLPSMFDTATISTQIG